MLPYEKYIIFVVWNMELEEHSLRALFSGKQETMFSIVLLV